MKRFNSKIFFTEEEKNRIEESVLEAEKKTSGEIVVMVVNQSSRYLDVDLSLSIFTGLIFASAGSLIFNRYNIYFFIPLFLFFLYFSKYIFNKFFFLKWFAIGKYRKEYEVKKKALQTFHENRLSNTRDKTGILILISLLEKKVHILADMGIYARMSQDNLDLYAKQIADGVKSGKPADAVCEAIESFSKLMKIYFPIKDDDKNELDNKVITG